MRVRIDEARGRATTTTSAQHLLPAAITVGVVVFLVQSLFVLTFGSNIPLYDEWTLIPLFARWQAGSLTFGDLFAQHNEHRLVIARLFFLTLFWLFDGWRPFYAMFVSAFFVGCTAATWSYTLRRLGACWWVILISCGVLISSLQFQTSRCVQSALGRSHRE